MHFYFDKNLGFFEHALKEAVIKEKTQGRPLVLHSDNRSPMKAGTFRATLVTLGIVKFYSRHRVSNDNPYSESIFRIIKYRSEYPDKGFESLEDARDWVVKLVRRYNYEHHHSGIKFVTPHYSHRYLCRNI